MSTSGATAWNGSCATTTGVPAASLAELAARREDAEALDWNTARLAERWEVSRHGAEKRVERLRETATPD